MPYVNIKITKEGATKKQKAEIIKGVTDLLVNVLDKDPNGTFVVIDEVELDDWGVGLDEALEVALRQLTLVEALLKRFLDLGRANAARHEPCSLKAVVAEAVALLSPQCRHAHTEVRWQPPAADFTLSGDADQLGHLFLNVLGNAIEVVAAVSLEHVNVIISFFTFLLSEHNRFSGAPKSAFLE